MTTLYQDKTGQRFYRPPGASMSELEPVTEEQAAMIEGSAGAAAGGALVTSVEQTLRALPEMMPGAGPLLKAAREYGGYDPLEMAGRPSVEALGQRQEDLARGHRTAAFVGRHAPDLLPIGVPGARVTAGIAAEAALAKPLAIAERVGLKTRAMVGRTQGIGAQVATEVGDDAARVFPDFLSSGELDNLAADLGTGRLGTNAKRAVFDATKGNIGRAEQRMGLEESFRGSVAGGVAHGLEASDANAQTAINRLLTRELDIPSAERLTPGNRLAAKDAASGEFEQAKELAGDLKIDTLELDDIAGVVGEDNRARIEGIVADMKLALGEDGTYRAAEAWAKRNELVKKASRAADAGNIPLASSIDQLVDHLDDVIVRQAALKDPGVAESLARARDKWRVVRSLEGAGVVDPLGNVNIKSFMNRYESHGNAAGQVSRRGERTAELYKNLISMRALLHKVSPDSGTAPRLMKMLGSKIPFVGGALQ